jgi:hypothetical protein
MSRNRDTKMCDCGRGYIPSHQTECEQCYTDRIDEETEIKYDMWVLDDADSLDAVKLYLKRYILMKERG